jgi:hypothetical protein
MYMISSFYKDGAQWVIGWACPKTGNEIGQTRLGEQEASSDSASQRSDPTEILSTSMPKEHTTDHQSSVERWTNEGGSLGSSD